MNISLNIWYGDRTNNFIRTYDDISDWIKEINYTIWNCMWIIRLEWYTSKFTTKSRWLPLHARSPGRCRIGSDLNAMFTKVKETAEKGRNCQICISMSFMSPIRYFCKRENDRWTIFPLFIGSRFAASSIWLVQALAFENPWSIQCIFNYNINSLNVFYIFIHLLLKPPIPINRLVL